MTIEALSPQDALIAVMIAVSAVDQNMTDRKSTRLNSSH